MNPPKPDLPEHQLQQPQKALKGRSDFSQRRFLGAYGSLRLLARLLESLPCDHKAGVQPTTSWRRIRGHEVGWKTGNWSLGKVELLATLVAA